MDAVERSLESLNGLSVGDALGAQFFVPGSSVADLVRGHLPTAPWPWTDDTEMACSLVAVLREGLDQDRLAATFAENFEPYRGYGGGAVVLLRQIREGADWRDVSRAAFNGQGSMGNGAAMRVAPLGAFHAGDPRTAALEAMRSAEVTHAHPEAILGAVAVAVAASQAAVTHTDAPTQAHPSADHIAAAHTEVARPGGTMSEARGLLDAVLDHLTESQVKAGIQRARELLGVSAAEAAYTLGNGSRVLAQDTVPFTLWVAATHLHDYRSAIVTCIEAGGDVDTTAAIVGGIVASSTGTAGIPPDWLDARESLPTFLPRDPRRSNQHQPRQR